MLQADGDVEAVEPRRVSWYQHITQLLTGAHHSVLRREVMLRLSPTDLYTYNLDTVPPIHVVWNHVGTDKLTTANDGTFTSSSARLSSQSR